MEHAGEESRMTDPTFAAITDELDRLLAQLKKAQDPETRKTLLVAMRRLIAELNDIVFGLKG